MPVNDHGGSRGFVIYASAIILAACFAHASAWANPLAGASPLAGADPLAGGGLPDVSAGQPVSMGGRLSLEHRASFDRLHILRVSTSGAVERIAIDATVGPRTSGDPRTSGGAAGTCPGPITVTHTDASFKGGTFVLQTGFEEGEIFAASYTIDPSEYPIKIESIEAIFATSNAIVETETQWSVLVWDGTPDTGTLVAEFSSDGDTLPHLVMPPGTGGVLLQVSIDPGDPNQIFISGASGTNTLSVGFRIDQHNAPGTPCILPPPANQNAFPNTDFGGLEAPTQNWIFAVDGIQCVCGAGWLTFQQLPAICTPTGDWVLRATYTCTAEPVFGACCDLTDGSCLDGGSGMTEEACESLGGEFEGEGTECDSIECPQPTAACCFLPSGCVNLDEVDCSLADGFWQGLGTSCDEIDCFPIGACCDPLGACTDDTSPDDCAASGGAFQGTNTVCDDTVCPAPIGGCCLANGSCLELIEDDCGQIPGSDWPGALTNCDDVDENGSADVCEALSILSSIPPNEAIDARQPFEPDGSNPEGWSSIAIEMTGDASGLTASDFSVGQEPGGEPPAVADITIDGNTVVLEFTGAINVGAWTVIRHLESDTTTRIGYLPADVNNDRTSSANDVLYLVDVLNGVVDPAPATYQTDVDRSDAVNASDILRVIDLLNGAGQYDVWIGATLP